MTIEEAIKYAEEVAATSCDECREKHEQLATWLKELKKTEDGINCDFKIQHSMGCCTANH